MLQFYYAPLSVNARRVWMALLEKQIPFEPIQLNLDGDQFSAEFTAINPLQRVPAIVDDGLRIVESFAILDYLEAKYPLPALLPQDLEALAIARMVAMISLTELQPATLPLIKQLVGLTVAAETLEKAEQRIITVLQFFETLLVDRPYFAGAFSLADIVAGTLVPSVAMFGIALDAYPRLNPWLERLSQRDSFQQTAPTPKQIQAALPNIRKILEAR
ncbi:glutathione S-transferase family protein [Egbenema bharatensis]|uniref:glutathione S-transferase family protein n=1 Tax=Egbenema bharatensis TaxID=3463334 RepID=UPI003A8B2914